MKNVLKEIFSTSLYILVVLIAVYLVITFVGQRTRVSGESMTPTLEGNDNLIVDKITYRFKDPERFDIIVFPYRYDPTTFYIKRIIGMPGETIRIDEQGNIFIDDEILEESYGKEVIRYQGRAAKPVTLGEDEYFVMGDNRNGSSDSREEDVGNIARDEIVGRAWIRIYPFDKFGVLKHQ
ncbi:MAG: signal peptidase I [Lachnospiraceae bacterium]|nr:signal peptidase I [Lachnospiraceae bacterium]